MIKEQAVCKEMCATCPFRKGSELAHLVAHLTQRAISEESRICHSTGSGNAVNHRTGKPPMVCRGARNVQLQVWHALGLLEAPTDEAWTAKVNEINRKKYPHASPPPRRRVRPGS